MVSTYTPCLALEKPAQNDYAASGWAAMQDANHDRIDQGFGQAYLLNLGSGASGNVNLVSYPGTGANAHYQFYWLSGTLAGDVHIIFPSGVGGRRYFYTPGVTFNGFAIYVRAYDETVASTLTFGCRFTTPYTLAVPVMIWPGWRAMWADYSSAPPGTIIDYGAYGNVPHGWVICDGHMETTTTLDLLFNIIGFDYGGSGTSFAMPDLRGRVTPGCDDMSGVTQGQHVGAGTAGRLFNWGLNGQGGQATIALGVGNLPSHNHTIDDQTHSHGDSGHAHGISDPEHTHGEYGHTHGASQDPHSHTIPGSFGYGIGPYTPAAMNPAGNTTTSSAQPNVYVGAGYANIAKNWTGIGINAGYAAIGAAWAGINHTNYTGSGAAFQTLQPSQTVYKLIRA